MANTKEIRKVMESPDSKRTAELLDLLDENSKTLAKVYISALADRQRMDGIKAAELAVAV